MKSNQDLTQGSIAGKLLTFFLPIAVGTIFQQLYNAVDAIIVGKFVGTVALAAVGGSSSQIINLIICFFVALAGGATVIIAQFFGAKDGEAMRRSTGTAVAFCIVTGIILSVVCIALTPKFLEWMASPEDTVADSTTYLRIYFASSAFVLLYNIESGILRAVGDSRTPLVILVVCCVCNIVLDLVFVLYLKLEVAGVAYATVISQIISAGLTTWKLRKVDGPYRLEWKYVRFDQKILQKMMHIGVPAGLQQSMFGISNLLLQVAVNLLGTTAVAAWSLSGKIDGFFWAVNSAAGTAITTFAGQNYGAGRIDRVKDSQKVGLKLFAAMTVAISGLILLTARSILPLFTDDPAVIDDTWTIIINIVPYYFIWIYIEIVSGILRGVGDAVPPVIICGLGICLFRVIWIMTVYKFIPTLAIVTLCYPCSWLVACIAFFVYYRKGKWLKAFTASE